MKAAGAATTPWGAGGGHGNGQKVSWSPAGPPLRAVGPQGRGALGPDLLSLFLSRGCPLGPGEPSHVPDGGARAHPHPAEPGGHCVGQLRAPGHRHGCHQPADSGTGLSSWLVGPSAGHPLLTLLTLYLVLLPRVSQGSVEFVRKQKGPTIPTGPCPLPPHASPGLPRGEGARLHRAVSCTLAVSAAAGGGRAGAPVLARRLRHSCVEDVASGDAAVLEAGSFKQRRGGGRWVLPRPLGRGPGSRGSFLAQPGCTLPLTAGTTACLPPSVGW